LFEVSSANEIISLAAFAFVSFPLQKSARYDLYPVTFLREEEAMRNTHLVRLALAFIALFGFALPRVVWAQASLDTPTPGSFQSGIGYVRGWKCTAGALTFTIDNGPPASLSYGSSRTDTAGVCKNDGNNGFIAQWNWNISGDGQHTIRVFDNGNQFAEATFTVTTLGVEFATSLAGPAIAPQFPNPNFDTILAWQENQQNFVLVGFQPHVSGGQICEPHTIAQLNSLNGLVQLEDGSVWVVNQIDRFHLAVWLPTQNALLCFLKTDFGGQRTLIDTDALSDNVVHAVQS
jgi:hypothetical protein